MTTQNKNHFISSMSVDEINARKKAQKTINNRTKTMIKEITEITEIVTRLIRQIDAMKNCENCTMNGCDDSTDDEAADFCLNHDYKYWQLGI